MKNPVDVANRWKTRLAGAGEAIKAGVLGVTQNPAEKAAQRADAWAAGVQRALADQRFQRGLRRVTLQSWQDATVNKGLPRIAAGAAQAQPKMQQFYEKFLPHMEALKTKLQGTPRGDLQTNIARMIMAVEHAASFKYGG